MVSKTIGWEFESLHPCKKRIKVVIKIGSYIRESVDELLHKVSWPTWSELQSSGIVVAIATIIISLLIYFMDTIFSGMMKIFYDFFG